MSPVCFLDLDGVLVDFHRAVLKRFESKLTIKEMKWDFLSQMGFNGVHDPAFWNQLGFTFWAGLPWTREGPRLLLAAERLFGAENICLLTSPPSSFGAVEGKVEWIKENLPTYSRQFLVGPPKALLAGPGKLLLDDCVDNFGAFITGGGEALVVPRPWNTRAFETDSEGCFDVSKFTKRIEKVVERLRCPQELPQVC